MVFDAAVVKLLQVYGDDPVHVTPSVICRIYKRIFGELPPGCVEEPMTQSDDVKNICHILNTLQENIIQVDLEHIDSEKVVHGDPVSVENLLEILAGYVEYILDAEWPHSQNVSDADLNENDMKPARELNNRTPTKRETLLESPVKSILSTPEHISAPDPQENSAFLSGYKKALDSSIDDSPAARDYLDDRESLLQKLSKLPNLSETLCKHGLDLTPSTVSSDVSSSVQRLRECSRNTDELLIDSESEIGECIAQSTPYPKQNENLPPMSSPFAIKTEENFKTPQGKSLDETIKNRLLYLLEKSGNTKSRKRHVRFNIPDSPGDCDHNATEKPDYILQKQKFEYELEKKILEEELKEKVDQLLLEKKKLRELAVQKTTPKPKKTPSNRSKTPHSKTPLNKRKKTPLKTKEVLVTSQTDDPIIKDYLLPNMLEDFPYLHVSPQTARVLWNKQVKQINALTHSDTNKTKLIKKHLEEEERRQELLLNLMKKELEFTTRVNSKKILNDEKRYLKAKLLEKKLTGARVRKYHQDYCKRTKARMCSKNFREEAMFKQLFDQGLKIQKEKLLDARKMKKEQREKDQRKHDKDMRELENYYKDQFDLMTNDLEEKERKKDILQKEKHSHLNKHKIYQRQKMKNEIELLQENLIRADEHLHYKTLDFEQGLQKLR